MADCGVTSLIVAKFIFYVNFTKIGLPLNDESQIIVSTTKILQILSICSSYISSLPMQIVHVLLSLSLLLLVVLCRMFSNHV